MEKISEFMKLSGMAPWEAGLNALIYMAILFVFTKGFRRKDQEGAQQYAALAAGLGVFGTFLGIAIGLYNFDVNAIEQSVPALLSGMKLAFGSSILGILSSLIIRYSKVPSNSTDIDTSSGEEAVAQMIVLLRDIKMGLIGEGDASLSTQMQKTRITLGDKQDELKTEFVNFAEKMAENNSNALIEALESVIKDFNQKISEQFGENFKQLNDGVGKMLEWQENNKSQMDSLAVQLTKASENLEISADALEGAAESVDAMAGKSDEIVSIVSDLSKVVSQFNKENSELESHLSDIASISDKSREAFPKLKEGLDKLFDEIEGSLNSVTKNIEITADVMNTNAEGQRERVAKVISDMNEQVNQHLKDNATNSTKLIQNVFDQNSENLSNQLVEFDKELKKNLEQSLNSLGQAMAALSKQFADDYSPITSKLKEIVDSARPVTARH